MKPLSNTACVSTVLGEICDGAGRWHTGFMPYGKLAENLGTTTADLMRRLKVLGIVEYVDGRHRLTQKAIRKRFGMVYQKRRKGGPTLKFDVSLPEGMVEVVMNLDATNLPETEIERMAKQGLSMSDIAMRVGCSKQAVHKHLNSLPPQLTDWPITGTWEDDDDEGESRAVNRSVLAA